MDRRYLLAGMGAAIILAALAGAARAQPTRDRILDSVRITRSDGCARIRIAFTFPVRYVSHFPYDHGDELRIQLDPIEISPTQRRFLHKRELVRPQDRRTASLEEVIYEGEIEGGPYLTLFFTKVVRFTAGQGSDFRSLSVTVPAAGASAPCASLSTAPTTAPQ